MLIKMIMNKFYLECKMRRFILLTVIVFYISLLSQNIRQNDIILFKTKKKKEEYEIYKIYCDYCVCLDYFSLLSDSYGLSAFDG